MNFAHIHGHRVGVLANQGVLLSEGALKAAHFIELCDQRGSPYYSTAPLAERAAPVFRM